MDKDYMESFEFITQGMANIFINDRLSQSENDASSVLLKVLRELHYINDTVLAMTNKESYCFRPVMEEEAPKRLPKFVPFKVKNR